MAPLTFFAWYYCSGIILLKSYSVSFHLKMNQQYFGWYFAKAVTTAYLQKPVISVCYQIGSGNPQEQLQSWLLALCTLLQDRSHCRCHNSAVITCDGIGPTKMTSGWIYTLRKLRGFMTLTSQSLVPPGIPLPSKPLTTFCYRGEGWRCSFGPVSTDESGKCLSRVCTATSSEGHLYCSALPPSSCTRLRGASLCCCRRDHSSTLGQHGRQRQCREVPWQQPTVC